MGIKGQDCQSARPPIADSDSDSESSCSSEDCAYAPFPFTVERVHLDISFNPGTTVVTNTMHISPVQPGHQLGSAAESCKQLVLDGKKLQLLEIHLDGKPLPPHAYTYNQRASKLTLHSVPSSSFELCIKSATHPEANTGLQGLFVRAGIYATACEAMGFRRISFWPDRPDVLSTWTVRLEGDAAALPVLLSNGNMTAAGQLPGGRHYAVWEDPWPKPCYLFSAVAGKLSVHEGSHTIASSGKQVAVRIYTAPMYEGKLDFALLSARAAMAWDEAMWGREYDLDGYAMAGVEGFLDDACETKGISLFHVHLLAVTPATHTDEEADESLRLIAHEYFHNFSGNRVTVRDWYQLTLKEGLTRCRDQAFAADYDAAASAAAAATSGTLGSSSGGSSNAAGTTSAVSGPAFPCSWHRVLEAQGIRCDQMPEDEGSLSHPIRPCRGTSLDNLYTDTVYDKGAEVVRMYHTILGHGHFYNGLQTFFKQHDGTAATCEDFCQAMFASDPLASLAPAMMRWYDTNGTPELTIRTTYSPSQQTLTLTVKQELETAKAPLLIPLKVGLVGPDGKDLPLHLMPATAGSSKPSKKAGNRKPSATNSSSSYTPTEAVTPGLCGSECRSMVLLLDSWSGSWVFSRLPERPAVSLLRDFSAPVRLHVEGETDKSLGFLALHDSNPFARWDAVQRLMTRLLMRLYKVAEGAAAGGESAIEAALAAAPGVPPALVAALQAALLNEELDGQYKALMLQLPGVMELVPQMDEPDPELLWMVKVHVGLQLARQLQPQLEQLVQQCDSKLAAAGEAAVGFWPPAVKLRAARNAALGLLSYMEDRQLQQQLLQRYYSASCMTERLAALELLADEDTPARSAALAHFHDTYRLTPSVLHKWLYVQAASDIEGNVEHVRALMRHASFDITDPAAVSALLGGFSDSMVNFHAENGSGYAFMADAVVEVDRVNPIAAADLAECLADWDLLDEEHQQLMKAQLRRLAGTKGLSADVREIVEDALEEGSSDDSTD
ncbi:hypothetical protein OEZ86_011181 [Tetradesmus obliquus]|nr:hypothetical protein OEZ86_011181 [Tetradesmus obliquus]